jgi:hypothetical protein
MITEATAPTAELKNADTKHNTPSATTIIHTHAGAVAPEINIAAHIIKTMAPIIIRSTRARVAAIGFISDDTMALLAS